MITRRLFFVLIGLLTIIVTSCYYDHYDELEPLSVLVNVCDSSYAATYSKSISTIMQNNCVSCHSSGLANGGVTLDSYAGVVAQVQNGQLMGCIQQNNGYPVMPPGTQIRSCEIVKLQQWINAGLPQ